MVIEGNKIIKREFKVLFFKRKLLCHKSKCICYRNLDWLFPEISWMSPWMSWNKGQLYLICKKKPQKKQCSSVLNNWTIFNEGFMRDIARKRLLKIQSNYTKFLHSCGSFQVIEIFQRNNEKYRKQKKKLCQKPGIDFQHQNFYFQEKLRQSKYVTFKEMLNHENMKSARIKYWCTALVIYFIISVNVGYTYNKM